MFPHQSFPFLHIPQYRPSTELQKLTIITQSHTFAVNLTVVVQPLRSSPARERSVTFWWDLSCYDAVLGNKALPSCSHLSSFTIHVPGVVSVARTWSAQTRNFFPCLSPWYLRSSSMVSLKDFSVPDGWINTPLGCWNRLTQESVILSHCNT